MLMFQQISACARLGVFEVGDEIHVADRARRLARQLLAGDVVLVEHPVVRAVEVQKAGARLADVAAQRRQLCDRADRVAAARLALKALPDPQQRRPRSVPVAARSIHAAATPVPAPPHSGVHGSSSGSSSSNPIVCASQELTVEQAVTRDHVRERERKRGVAAGKRLQVQVGLGCGGGPDRVDDDHLSGRLRQPVLVLVRRRHRRVRAPDHDARRVGRRSRDRTRPPSCHIGSRAPRDRPCCRSCQGRPRALRAGAGSASGSDNRAARTYPCNAP